MCMFMCVCVYVCVYVSMWVCEEYSCCGIDKTRLLVVGEDSSFIGFWWDSSCEPLGAVSIVASPVISGSLIHGWTLSVAKQAIWRGCWFRPYGGGECSE